MDQSQESVSDGNGAAPRENTPVNKRAFASLSTVAFEREDGENISHNKVFGQK